MLDGQVVATRRSLLWVALGRQRVGKTALLNAAIQYFRGRGSEIEVWNADQQNQSHSLSTFHADAVEPPSGGVDETRRWIEGRLFDQTERRYHAVLDVGGGQTAFSSLIGDVPILEAMAEQGTDVVGLFCIGPEQADLDFLRQFAASGSFLPKATMIVMNEGLVPPGRNAQSAFAEVMGSPIVMSALKRGGEVVMFPALRCLAEVTDRGLSFADASEGRVKPGQARMAMFDPVRVREWWNKKIPTFFDKFPAAWLPEVPVGSQSTSARAAE